MKNKEVMDILKNINKSEVINCFKEIIYDYNKDNKEKFKKIIKEYQDKNFYEDIIIENGGYAQKNSKYEYDFIWQDITYLNERYRICFYYQDIDRNTLNVHIFHGKYTFQKNLVQNNEKSRTQSVFDKNKCLKNNFEEVVNNTKYSSFCADNFDVDKFITEVLNFIDYPNENRKDNHKKIGKQDVN